MEKITKTYPINEVKKATLNYFKGDELARDTWIKKYCLKENETLFELTPDDMHKRIARELARIENKYSNPLKEDEIYETIKNFKRIVPQGSPMSGIGNNYQIVSLGNCFRYNTNIVTTKGLLPIGSLVGIKPILYSENGQWIESEVKSFGVQEIVKLTLIRNNNEKIIETTSDHIWYAKKYRSDSYHEFKTHELKKEYILKYNFAKNCKQYKPSPFGVAHGFYTGDGDKWGNDRIGKRILILKHDEELIPYFTNKGFDDELNSIHIGSLPNYFKNLPELNENVSYLYGWLAGYFAADGCIDERGSIIINSVNIDNLKHIKEVSSILGIGTYDIKKQDRISNLTKKDSRIYGIRLMSSTLNKSFFIKEVDKNRFIENTRKSYWRVKDVEYTGVKDNVYCAIVPETSNFTLEDNILTHNCFVIGNTGDSYGGIMRIDEEQTQLMKRRGGVGHDLSKIRPESTPVKNSAITSTGIIPFMERYSNSTKETAQSGRRGALMLSVSIKHPDSEAFIDAKMTEGKITGANVSVRIHDDFMESIVSGKEYIQQYPVDSDKPIIKKTINADKIWKKIVHNAWKSAEPGILFWDKIINESIPSCYGKEWTETSTNPCGELPLPPYDSCRLLAINLFGYVVNPFTPNAYFNWELFKSDVEKALRYMDDIVDLELEKIDKILEKIESDPEDEEIKWVERKLWEKIRKKAEQGRRTGLGITGEGDMLAGLNLRYGNDDATDFAEEVHKVLKLEAYRSSVNLAKERGAFPIYSAELENDNPFILRIKEEDYELYCDMQQYGRRNIALLTIAPTGTASIMTQTTSGIEPVFLPVYKRRRKINPSEKDVKIDFVDDEGIAWQEYIVFHHKFEIWLKANDYDISIVKTMSKEQLDEIVKKSPYYKATSNDIDWVKKVKMQGRIQKHIDHSISVTVNLPEDITEDIVSKVYETGWRSGCKGITVYRDGSRSGVLVGVNEQETETIKDIHAPKRPKRLKGDIHHFQNALEKWIAVVGIKDGRPYEIFTGKYENGLSKLSTTVTECEIVKNIIEVEELNDLGEKIKVRKKRYDIEYVDSNGEKHIHTGLNHAFNPEFWNYAKLISGILRHGMPLNYVVELINSLNFKEDYINTWKKGVGRVIKRYIKDGEKAKGVCLDCGSSENLEYKEGCLTCMACGSSKCG